MALPALDFDFILISHPCSSFRLATMPRRPIGGPWRSWLNSLAIPDSWLPVRIVGKGSPEGAGHSHWADWQSGRDQNQPEHTAGCCRESLPALISAPRRPWTAARPRPAPPSHALPSQPPQASAPDPGASPAPSHRAPAAGHALTFPVRVQGVFLLTVENLLTPCAVNFWFRYRNQMPLLTLFS